MVFFVFIVILKNVVKIKLIYEYHDILLQAEVTSKKEKCSVDRVVERTDPTWNTKSGIWYLLTIVALHQNH
jgi:hypothetical protein